MQEENSDGNWSRLGERVGAMLAPVRGLPVREAAKRLGVSPATAHRWLSQKTSSELTLQTR